MTDIVLVELADGWIELRETFHVTDSGQLFIVVILLLAIFSMIVSIAEKLMFRGYLLLSLAEEFNLRFIGSRGALILTWLLSSVIFGFFHIISPNITVVAS